MRARPFHASDGVSGRELSIRVAHVLVLSGKLAQVFQQRGFCLAPIQKRADVLTVPGAVVPGTIGMKDPGRPEGVRRSLPFSRFIFHVDLQKLRGAESTMAHGDVPPCSTTARRRTLAEPETTSSAQRRAKCIDAHFPSLLIGRSAGNCSVMPAKERDPSHAYLSSGCSFGSCFAAHSASLWRIDFCETSSLASGWINLSWTSNR